MMIPRKQRGAVLIVSLLFLLVMTILAVSTISSSNVNLLIVNNVQNTLQTEAAAQYAIEQTLDNIDLFSSPSEQSLQINERNVAVSRAHCRGYQPAPGFSAKWALAPEDTVWELAAEARDPVSGANATITQGVRILMVSGSCIAAEQSTNLP